MINEIVLRRKGHIYIEEHVSYEKSPVPQKKRLRVLTMMRNIEQLGFTFSQELYEQLACMKEPVQNACYLELVRLLKEQVGAMSILLCILAFLRRLWRRKKESCISMR